LLLFSNRQYVFSHSTKLFYLVIINSFPNIINAIFFHYYCYFYLLATLCNPTLYGCFDRLQTLAMVRSLRAFLLQRRGSRLRSCLQCQIISDRHVGHWRDVLSFALFLSPVLSFSPLRECVWPGLAVHQARQIGAARNRFNEAESRGSASGPRANLLKDWFTCFAQAMGRASTMLLL